MQNFIFFDVGANNGRDSIPRAANDPNAIVYAFEPTPELISELKTKTSHLKNYHIVEKAVSNFEGKTKFFIAGQLDWGCSSLLQFSDKSQNNWPGRTDFKVTNEIEVEVITLKSFIENNNIDHIDYLHIDTQGSDLKVLEGLGEKISIVRAGVMEAGSHTDILYYNQNTAADSIKFLNENGFSVSRIESNDVFTNEVNIHFHRN